MKLEELIAMRAHLEAGHAFHTADGYVVTVRPGAYSGKLIVRVKVSPDARGDTSGRAHDIRDASLRAEEWIDDLRMRAAGRP